MGWTIVVGFLVPALVLHAFLLVARPGRPAAAALGYATCGLAALALLCAASAWRGSEADLRREIAVRSQMDRDVVMLIHAIDAARDMACNAQPPTSTDAALLAAYTSMRTSCAFYMTMWIEAGRASDLSGVLAAAETPLPATGSPKQQLWSYAPLKAEAAKVEARVGRPRAAQPEARLGEALPLVLAGLLAVALSTVTAGLLLVAPDRPG